MAQPELFDPPPALREFESAFEVWASEARTHSGIEQRSSIAAYRVLWHSLIKWCLAQSPPLSLDSLTADALERFIAKRARHDRSAKALSPRYVWRLLTLIDRVQHHHAQALGAQPNGCACELLQARPQWRHANAAVKDPLPDHLTAAQAKDLVNFLSIARPRPGRRDADHTWQELRNRASVALQLGAGITPGEVRALQLGSVVSEGAPRVRIVVASIDQPRGRR